MNQQMNRVMWRVAASAVVVVALVSTAAGAQARHPISGRVIAQVMGYGSYVAGVAEVSVSPDGVLKMHKITAATDPGYAVNPWLIERQVAGSFVYGLSAALYGEITVKNGVVEQTNFDSYNVLRMDEMPEVETVIVGSGGFWGGVGEPTIAVAAPSVLNAIYKATGKRVRELPLMHQELKKGA